MIGSVMMTTSIIFSHYHLVPFLPDVQMMMIIIVFFRNEGDEDDEVDAAEKAA